MSTTIGGCTILYLVGRTKCNSNLQRPKSESHSRLDEYREAKRLGAEGGDCMDAYQDCPVSIFNAFPDVYAEEERFNITIDDFGAGSDVKQHLKDLNIDINIVPPK